MAENAVDNGVELRIRREVVSIQKDDGSDDFVVKLNHWEPQAYIDAQEKYPKGDGGGKTPSNLQITVHALVLLSTAIVVCMGGYMTLDHTLDENTKQQASIATMAAVAAGLISFSGFVTNVKQKYFRQNPGLALSKLPFSDIVAKVSKPVGANSGNKVSVDEMFIGGSGAAMAVKGKSFKEETVKAKYIINCAGGASDKVAKMIGDVSFKIKPRLGDYLLLNRNQVGVSFFN